MDNSSPYRSRPEYREHRNAAAMLLAHYLSPPIGELSGDNLEELEELAEHLAAMGSIMTADRSANIVKSMMSGGIFEARAVLEEAVENSVEHALFIEHSKRHWDKHVSQIDDGEINALCVADVMAMAKACERLEPVMFSCAINRVMFNQHVGLTLEYRDTDFCMDPIMEIEVDLVKRSFRVIYHPHWHDADGLDHDKRVRALKALKFARTWFDMHYES